MEDDVSPVVDATFLLPPVVSAQVFRSVVVRRVPKEEVVALFEMDHPEGRLVEPVAFPRLLKPSE